MKTGLWAAALVLACLVLASLACEANAVNMAIQGTPRYTCPSSTPRPTDIAPPPDPPTYPAAFQANLNYLYVDPNRSVVNVQYLAQSAGWVRVSYFGTLQGGGAWTGSSGEVYLAYSGTNTPGFSGVYGVFIPVEVISAQIVVSSSGGSYSFGVVRYASPVPGSPAYPPCCLPPPIYPTPRPTYTPYPTPTLFSIPPYGNGGFFLDDPIYNDQPPIQLRLRLKSPIQSGSLVLPFFGLGWTAASWTLEISNVGTKEYDFLGAGYLYISEVRTPSGGLVPGVWSPAHNAAQFLGVVEQAYGPKAILPGVTVSVTVAAWIPVYATVSKVSLVLDPYHSGDPGWATFTPGQGRVITWTNQVNTICKGEIQYP
jgi:hypothetical protein